MTNNALPNWHITQFYILLAIFNYFKMELPISIEFDVKSNNFKIAIA
jgi:hypothetical protein